MINSKKRFSLLSKRSKFSRKLLFGNRTPGRVVNYSLFRPFRGRLGRLRRWYSPYSDYRYSVFPSSIRFISLWGEVRSDFGGLPYVLYSPSSNWYHRGGPKELKRVLNSWSIEGGRARYSSPLTFRIAFHHYYSNFLKTFRRKKRTRFLRPYVRIMNRELENVVSKGEARVEWYVSRYFSPGWYSRGWSSIIKTYLRNSINY